MYSILGGILWSVYLMLFNYVFGNFVENISIYNIKNCVLAYKSLLVEIFGKWYCEMHKSITF